MVGGLRLTVHACDCDVAASAVCCLCLVRDVENQGQLSYVLDNEPCSNVVGGSPEFLYIAISTTRNTYSPLADGPRLRNGRRLAARRLLVFFRAPELSHNPRPVPIAIDILYVCCCSGWRS